MNKNEERETCSTNWKDEVHRKVLRLNYKGRNVLRNVLEIGKTDCDAVE
jgi:hypothetical protein